MSDDGWLYKLRWARPEWGYCKKWYRDKGVSLQDGCVGLDPSEGTARFIHWAQTSTFYKVALGSTRVRVLQVACVFRSTVVIVVALGSTRVRVLQDSWAPC